MIPVECWSAAIGRKYRTRGGRVVEITSADPLRASDPGVFVYTYSGDGLCNETSAADLMEQIRGEYKPILVEREQSGARQKPDEAKS